MTEMMLSFDFDCPNKLRFDLSQVTGLVPTSMISLVDDWFMSAHESHESSESMIDSEVAETANMDAFDSVDRLKRDSVSPTVSSTKKVGHKRGRDDMDDSENSRNHYHTGYGHEGGPPARKMKNVNGLAVKLYKNTGVMSMNPARLAEKFHRQRVKNNLIALNNANVQILPETKKVQAQAKVSTQAEIAKENALAKERLNANKKNERKRAEIAAQVQKVSKPRVKKTHSVMAVRKWEAKSGKQYALLSGPEREIANEEISDI